MKTRIAAVCCVLLACATAPTIGEAKSPKDLDIIVDVDVGEPVMIAGQDQTAYVKITLGGFALPRTRARTPINLALVLDRSSSMSGDKLEKAKEAALMVVDRLQPDDIVSVISYDSTVEVLVPAARAQERDHIRQRIRALTPRGSTALFAGVSYGIEEVGKFLDPRRVNRIVLLSDGQANIGPSSPNELGRLGEVAAKQGISISTIGLGLGYNEDLMAQLARRSDGNHAFAQNAADLSKIFNHELGDILSVVAQDVEVEILFDRGIVPVRSLHRDARIHGNKVKMKLNQLYAEQEKFFLMEVKVPGGAAGQTRQLARVDVRYDNMVTRKKGRGGGAVGVAFSTSKKLVASRQNRDVMVAAVEAIATERNRRAVALRDRGQVEQAEKVLKDNARYLENEGRRLKSKKLRTYGKKNFDDSRNLAPGQWNKQRKSMREEQLKNSSQRAW